MVDRGIGTLQDSHVSDSQLEEASKFFFEEGSPKKMRRANEHEAAQALPSAPFLPGHEGKEKVDTRKVTFSGAPEDPIWGLQSIGSAVMALCVYYLARKLRRRVRAISELVEIYERPRF
jgi:hypothetical protein